MRLSTIVSASLMAIGALAAKQQPEQRFQDFHSKSLVASPVKLADSSFKKLTGTPRDYTAMVLLTAMDARYGCQLCREFQPEWDILARSWTNGDKKGDSRVIFGTLDFADGRETFMSLGLQTAPVLLLFQPTTGPHAVASPEPIRYDFTTGPQVAEQVHSWLARHLPGRPQPPIRRPINWMRLFSWTVLSLGAVTAFVTAYPYLVPLIQSRKLWAGLSLFAILLFTSGHMFNQIRKVPYVAGNGKGGVSYFAGGFQNQFGMETQVVAGVYALLAFCAIGLATKVPRMTDPKRQQIAVVTWGVVLFVLYSFLLSIFRIKNGGYPFSLPPFM